MRFDILTLFPRFFDSPLTQSIIGRAIKKGVIDVRVHNIRDYAADKHRTTDDAPYGGGCGMILKVTPVVRAIESIKGELRQKKGKKGENFTPVVLATPQGAPLNHKMAQELSRFERIIIVCGRYEGVDERIRAHVDREISIGDYIVTGGEIPALALIDCVGRFIPGVLGDIDSSMTESFAAGLLEYPQYTRPRVFREERVPDVLLSGNHLEIERWRRKESIGRTLERRPDLLKMADITDEDKKIIKELKGG